MALSSLDFPEVDYRASALKTVVCQLVFDPILRIGAEAPVGFQDSVRGTFTKFGRQDSLMVPLVSHDPSRLITSPVSTPFRQAVWTFTVPDGSSTARLAVDNLSLESSRFSGFAAFAAQLATLREALQAVYGVPSYARIGLRYINLYESSRFPGGWKSKFNHALLGAMSDAVLGEHVRAVNQVLFLSLEPGGMTIHHGTQDDSYVLDLDRWVVDQVQASAVGDMLRAFNREAYLVFRWSISDELHTQMEPQSRDAISQR